MMVESSGKRSSLERRSALDVRQTYVATVTRLFTTLYNTYLYKYICIYLYLYIHTRAISRGYLHSVEATSKSEHTESVAKNSTSLDGQMHDGTVQTVGQTYRAECLLHVFVRRCYSSPIRYTPIIFWLNKSVYFLLLFPFFTLSYTD